MSILGNEASDLMIDQNTVSSDIGLCYYDPLQETILELSSLPDSMLFCKPRKKKIFGFYAVAKMGANISSAKISVSANEDIYRVKILHQLNTPSESDFDLVPPNNEVVLTSVQEEHLNPIWLQIQSMTGKFSLQDLELKIEY